MLQLPAACSTSELSKDRPRGREVLISRVMLHSYIGICVPAPVYLGSVVHVVVREVHF